MKTRVKGTLTITVSLTPGTCRWCGCTYERPCENGCSWVERTQTLCSECVPLDATLQTQVGRRELAEFLQEQDFTRLRHGRPIPAKARARQ